jgi:hypothetical protein
MIIAYMWYMQGKDKWAIRDIATWTTVYTDYVHVWGGFTVNNGRSLGLPVNHAMALTGYSLEQEDTLPPEAPTNPALKKPTL